MIFALETTIRDLILDKPHSINFSQLIMPQKRPRNPLYKQEFGRRCPDAVVVKEKKPRPPCPPIFIPPVFAKVQFKMTPYSLMKPSFGPSEAI